MIENALAIGSVLKGATTYTIDKQLHQGGFGITYLAKAQIMVGNISQVATFTIKEFFMGKICSRDANGNVQVAQENQQLFKQAKQDFREEAEILHALKHANIVPVNEVFEQNNTVYYVMAYLGKVSLYQYVSACNQSHADRRHLSCGRIRRVNSSDGTYEYHQCLS